MTQILYPDIEDENKRLDIFLVEKLENISRSTIQNLIKHGEIKVNDKNSKSSYTLKENDRIEIQNTLFEEISIQAENIELDIRYEDEDIIVINKPKNMLTHPTSKELEKTLVNALLYKYGYEGLSSINGKIRPGIVHRLDRNTSGLLMVAKNNTAHEFLCNQIKTKTAIRKYLAIVSGTFDTNTGTIDAEIARNPSKCEKFTVMNGGKPSITHYKVIERFKNHTLLEIQLETGRTHQIRVHMSYIGHPIVNDSLYGGEKLNVKTTEQVLQSYKLSFDTIKNVRIDIEISPDEDIQKVLNKLRSQK